MHGRDPKWLEFLTRKLEWISIPHLALYFVTIQGLGFLFCLSYPQGPGLLALFPDLVLRGEYWRLVSFLAMPLSYSPIWFIFAAWFAYFILQSIEAEWGEVKTTLYVLISLALTVLFSFVFDYPIIQVQDFFSTLFLAAAALFPEFEMRIYLIFPVKMKYLGWLALFFLAFRLVQGTWMDRLFLLAIYSNYFLFFGPALLYRIKDWKRRRDYRSKFR
jgi:hypothetical protein